MCVSLRAVRFTVVLKRFACVRCCHTDARCCSHGRSQGCLLPHCLRGPCGTVVAGVPREPHGEARSRRAAVDCDCAHDHRATHDLMLLAAVLNSLRTAGSRTMLSSLGSMGHGRRQRKKRKRSCHSLLVHEWARMPHARERQARDRLPSAVRGALRDLPLWLCLCLIW